MDVGYQTLGKSIKGESELWKQSHEEGRLPNLYCTTAAPIGGIPKQCIRASHPRAIEIGPMRPRASIQVQLLTHAAFDASPIQAVRGQRPPRFAASAVASSILRLHEPLVRIANAHRIVAGPLAKCRASTASIPRILVQPGKGVVEFTNHGVSSLL